MINQINTYKIIEIETNLIDTVFMELIESTGENYDKEKAREFGLAHWAELTEKSRRLWDWVFGKETRVKKFVRTPRHIEKKLAIMEDEAAGFDGPFKGTV